ncbi:MAG: hypothetical protein WB239_01530 [Acidimicrobiia bacterium]
MTAPRGRHPFVVAAWMLVMALVVAVSVGLMAGILSPALVVDLVAMWPLVVVVIAAGLVGSWRGHRHHARAGAILPLAIISAFVFAISLHLGGWSQLPTAEARLTGPPAEELSNPTRLTAHISGALVVGSTESGAGYRVDPILRGGSVGVPQSTETTVDGALSIILSSAQEAPSWYRFSGWKLGLAPVVGWRLILNGAIDADLSTLEIDGLALGGSGSVILGPPPEPGAEVVLSGDFHMSVPAGTAARVVGPATVPSGWSRESDGFSSPGLAAGGPIWTIRVKGDTALRLSER